MGSGESKPVNKSVFGSPAPVLGSPVAPYGSGGRRRSNRRGRGKTMRGGQCKKMHGGMAPEPGYPVALYGSGGRRRSNRRGNKRGRGKTMRGGQCKKMHGGMRNARAGVVAIIN